MRKHFSLLDALSIAMIVVLLLLIYMLVRP
jgi:hypothetical protein